MALSDETIAEIGKARGLGCKVADAGYPCDMLWFDGNPTPFARAIEAEVRKEDTELIWQLVEALEHIHRCIPMGGFAQIHWGSSTFEQVAQAAEAGRARLEGKP